MRIKILAVAVVSFALGAILSTCRPNAQPLGFAWEVDKAKEILQITATDKPLLLLYQVDAPNQVSTEAGRSDAEVRLGFGDAVRVDLKSLQTLFVYELGPVAFLSPKFKEQGFELAGKLFNPCTSGECPVPPKPRPNTELRVDALTNGR